MTAVPVRIDRPAIEVEHVSKWFGGVVAVSDVSFTVTPGVTALLGPNGAGKSTLLRLLCGLAAPSRGAIRVLGLPPRGDVRLYRRLGLVAQQEALLEGLSGVETVRVSARLRGVADAAEAARGALERVELDPADPRPVSTYSKGMRQRVKVAAALVHEPEVLFLDEPLEGLDPRQRLRMIELVRTLGARGRTVLVSSHVLDEVERLGSTVLVLAQGRLVATGDFRRIRALMDERPHRLLLRTDRPRPLAAVLLTGGAVVGTRLHGSDEVVVDTTDVAAFRRSVAASARAADARLFEVVPLDDDLESVFRYLVTREPPAGAGARRR